MPIQHESQRTTAECGNACFALSRRELLFGAGATIVSLSIPGLSTVAAQAQIADHPRRIVGRLSQLKLGEPLAFRYPWDHAQCASYLLKLGQEAAGGVGPVRDIVAFNALCTHMGATIPRDGFKAALGIAGPCPLHWTTFDLTRYGMVVSGHATQGLPQVVLATEDDDIVATGVLGLIFGLADNHARLPG